MISHSRKRGYSIMKSMTKKALPILAGVLAVNYCATAQAAVIVYNTEATFLANSGSVVLEDFNSATPVVLNAGVNQATGSVSVRHDGSDSNSFISDATGTNNIDATTHLDIFVGPEVPGFFPAETFTITLPAPATAAGFEIADFFSVASSEGANVSAGSDFAFNTAAEGLAATGGAVPAGFIGFTSDTPFTDIVFNSDAGFGEAFGIDNLVYNPEPSTLAILSLAGVAVIRRRR